MNKPEFSAQLLAPKYWFTWLGFGVWYGLSQLPYRWQLVLGKGLGALLYRTAKRRKKIAYANIRMCFPEKSEAECHALVKGVIDSVAIAFFETGMAWFWSKERLERLRVIHGTEYLEQAEAEGAGIILIALHFTHIDIGAKLLAFYRPINGSYRPHNNPVYDYVQRTGRERQVVGGRVIPREDVRGMVKALRAGEAIWYAPDQDYGPKHSQFVPFFGISAATITATSQLARLGKAKIIPFTQTRKSDGSGYQLDIHPPLENFPSGDEYEDALRINQLVERLICRQPEQYLWVHRRFKTRPPGEPDLYEPFGVGKKKRR